MLFACGRSVLVVLSTRYVATFIAWAIVQYLVGDVAFYVLIAGCYLQCNIL